ncbi:MAG: protein-L-isoaspartate(D-aspartate) O-methyltransferase [Sedimentisphaerales bacterium]|nr:protein-L-isoaspartate(D-aspartate) O-methyltransferase [Sedimentisphaerales bacterium]
MKDVNNQAQFTAARYRMIKRDLKGRDITDSKVLKVMIETAREEFVSEAYKSQAYADRPLPIGMGQTISQPYIVALMTQELRVNRNCEVLEIGTGSGYQTAILSKLAEKVYTVERNAQLSESAQAVLARLGFTNIEFYIGDGSSGWPNRRWDCDLQRSVDWQSCFDRIIVTASVPKMPQHLSDQLADGGIMIAPVGSPAVQQLVRWEKQGQNFRERYICEVRFVKLIGEYGFEQ